MLQMLDDGQITDSKGTKVNFKNCIIIFTSNIGSRDIIELGGADGDQALMKQKVSDAMRDKVSLDNKYTTIHNPVFLYITHSLSH